MMPFLFSLFLGLSICSLLVIHLSVCLSPPLSLLIVMMNTFFQVVQYYGHGANGVSMSWGTSIDAAELVKDALYVKNFYNLSHVFFHI